MPSWPDYLPQPVFDAISIGAPVGAVLRTEMGSGPAKQRRRFTAAPHPVALVFEPITALNLAMFEAFYKTELGFGALEFEMPHPITDAVCRFRFVTSDTPWGVSPIGSDAYRLNVSLELLP